MSRLCFQSRDVVVYDDVLSPQDYTKLFRHLNSAEYRSVHHEGWRKVWRLHDGNPLRSGVAWYYPVPPSPPSNEKIFPTQTPIDAIVAWIADKLPEIQAVVGTASVQWSRFSFAPWVYPTGSGLSLHRDGNKYSGAFTYFAHRKWGLHWGGHLLVLDPLTAQRAVDGGEQFPFLSDEDETARVFNPGLALTVLAKPNRIVFLSPDAQHALTRVDMNAGQEPRLSVAGFFHKDME